MTLLKIIAAPSLAILAALAGCSSHGGSAMQHRMADADYQPSGNYMGSSAIGPVLTTPDGLTVYTFDQDSPGVSSCYDDCAEEWPPVTAAAGAQPFGKMSVIERKDGKRQWAYDGMPLYHYDDDDSPGDVEGDNEGGVWHVVK